MKTRICPFYLIIYTTIFNSDGGGGNSFKPVTSLPESSTFVEETPIEAVTHCKEFRNTLHYRQYANSTTFSVICFKTLVSAPLPAAQATVKATFFFLNSLNHFASHR
jgi:hypothetical protein